MSENEEVVQDILIGARIDGFTICEKVGEGGFSTVYRVVPNGLQKSFALKYVRDKQHLPLLEAEAEILAKLEHPQIPTPVRLGEMPAAYGGGAYLIMDFVPSNLQKTLTQKGKFKFSEAMEVVKQLLRILKYTHSQNIIHKDLKPKNIGIDADGNVILLDFNIAKTLEKTLPKEDKSNLQQSGLYDSHVVQVGNVQRSLLGGTEGYRSPEQKRLQINGKIYPVEAQSDLYTLGILFYEMLVGFVPEGNFQKPSELVNVPKWVDNIIDKALAPSPKDRFQTAQSMLSEIEKGQAGVFDLPSRSDQVLTATKSRLQSLGRAIKQVVLFPIWLLLFGPARHYDKQGSEGLACLCGVLTVIAYVVAIVTPIIWHAESQNQKLMAEFANERGTIVFADSNQNIWFFPAKTSAQNQVPFRQILTPVHNIRDLAYIDSGTVCFIGGPRGCKEDRWDTVYLVNLHTGNNRIVYSLPPPPATTAKEIQSLRVINEDGNKSLAIRIGDAWRNLDYLTGKTTVRHLMIADATDPAVSPNKTHRAGYSRGCVIMKFNTSEWGNFNVQNNQSGEQPGWINSLLWIDYDLGHGR